MDVDLRQPSRVPLENIVLIVHLILAFCLIGIVLLQRSEGGGLGMGGGGGGTMSSRGQITALGKLTWALAAAFIATSITLTILAARDAEGTSVLDRVGFEGPAEEEPVPAPGLGEDLLPPGPGEGGAAVPPPAEGGAAPPPPASGDAPAAPPPVE